MNKKLNEVIDEKISNCLSNKAKEISVPEDMFFKVRAEILKENKGVLYKMKIKFLRARTAIAAGILCVATTVTCAAATSGLFTSTHSNWNNAIRTFPSSDTVKSTVGFLPKYVDGFDGGFKFDSFLYSETSSKDDSGKEVNKAREANFNYKRDGASKNQILSMDAETIDKDYFNKEANTFKDIAEYNGIKIYYASSKYKAVPESYQKTEEDIKLINEGLLQIGYGADKVEENNTQTVEWYENGIKYSIWNQAYDDVSRDGMLDMAKKVIG